MVNQGKGGPGPHAPCPGGWWQPSLDVRQGVMSFPHTRLLKRDGPQVLGGDMDPDLWCGGVSTVWSASPLGVWA